MTPSARDPLDLRQRHGVETPEHVEVQLELAGLGSRMAAALLDSLLLFLTLVLLSIIANALMGPDGPRGLAGGWAAALVVLLFFALFFGYFAAFEALNGGRTPGKQSLGIRVVMDTGRPVTPAAAVVRNLVRLLDCYFPLLPFLPAVTLMFLHKSNKRLGDMAAGTIVVRDRPTEWLLGAKAEPEREEPVEAGPPELSEDEFRLLDRFLGRLNELEPAVQ
ncbi:MAG TPA: RDD family protein, partial [Gemmatimonadales bacterium]|nr:RDD family protein [Gemmatimonadales bacterium]